MEKVRQEFTEKVGRVVLLPTRMAKTFDGTRVRNVVWKITREIFFIETERFLPEDTPVTFQFLSTDDQPPIYLSYIDTFPSRGRYTGVFDFKYTQMPEVHNSHWWAYLFWDKIIAIVIFHDPSPLSGRPPVT